MPERDVLIPVYLRQAEFLQCTAPFAAMKAGIGSGKSFVLCLDTFLRCQRRPGLYLIGAPTYPLLRDATIRSFFNVTERIGVRCQFNKTEHQAAR
jgi:hypothetical protein